MTILPECRLTSGVDDYFGPDYFWASKLEVHLVLEVKGFRQDYDPLIFIRTRLNTRKFHRVFANISIKIALPPHAKSRIHGILNSIHARVRFACINLSARRLGTVRGFWRKLHRTRTHASPPSPPPCSVVAIIMHRTSRAKERSAGAKERERKKRKGRKSTRSKKRDTVMTQTSCILVPHKARQLWERACVVTHARVLTSGIDDHARHGLFITDSGPLLSFSPLLLRGEEGRERHLEICCPKLPLLEFSRFGE